MKIKRVGFVAVPEMALIIRSLKIFWGYTTAPPLFKRLIVDALLIVGSLQKEPENMTSKQRKAYLQCKKLAEKYKATSKARTKLLDSKVMDNVRIIFQEEK